MTNEELRDGLVRLAKRTGFSFLEIDYMARMIAQTDIDPLPPAEWGAPFEFATRKLSVIDDDFLCINPEVGKPDAQVDLLIAFEEFKRDVVHVDQIYAQNPPLPMDKHWLLFVNQWDWTRFWSVRHPDSEARAEFARGLSQFDQAASRIGERVDAHLRKRGISLNRT